MNYLMQESKVLQKYNVFPSKNHGMQTVVFIHDGSTTTVGLADLLRAICAIYQWSKNNNKIFKLICNTPFEMTDYLVPNKYNWQMDKNELDFENSKPRAIFTFTKFYGLKEQEKLSENSLNKLLGIHTKQLHLYSNLICYDSFFYENFHELFKTNQTLEEELKTFQQEIGGEYITISFRFTQLLGDLQDCFAEPLPESERKKLIEVCLKSIKSIIEKNNVDKAVVTSDSNSFLAEVSKLPYVHLLPGEIDNIINSDVTQAAVRKTFWDTMMIARARKAYMVRTPIMYTSGFAKRAAMIGGIPFEEVLIEQ